MVFSSMLWHVDGFIRGCTECSGWIDSSGVDVMGLDGILWWWLNNANGWK